jgi:hypothetical protein
MPWPDNAALARAILLLYETAQLIFLWWYLGTWYWLPTASVKRLFGWVVVMASFLVLPLKVYPEAAHGIHRDSILVILLFFDGIALLGILFYRIRRRKAPVH